MCFKQLLAALPVLIFAGTAFPQTHLKIGISTPLTGDAATYGTDIRNVLSFANDVLAKNKYELVIEDDRCGGKEAVAVAQKLTAVDKVDAVLGVVCTTSLNAASPIYERAGVTVITPTANLDGVTAAGKTTFTTVPSDTAAMKPLADYVCSKHKVIAVLSEPTDMAQQMRSAFEARCEDHGATVTADDFQAEQKDFRSLILRIITAKAEGVFINSQTEASFIVILKQLREINRALPVYGAMFPGTPAFLDQAGSLAEGIVFVDLPDLDDALNSEGAKLYREYVSRYGEMKSIGFLFVTAFESFRSMHSALNSGEVPAEHIANTTFTGLLGKYSFDDRGEVSGIAHTLKRILQGKARPLI